MSVSQSDNKNAFSPIFQTKSQVPAIGQLPLNTGGGDCHMTETLTTAFEVKLELQPLL